VAYHEKREASGGEKRDEEQGGAAKESDRKLRHREGKNRRRGIFSRRSNQPGAKGQVENRGALVLDNQENWTRRRRLGLKWQSSYRGRSPLYEVRRTGNLGRGFPLMSHDGWGALT